MHTDPRERPRSVARRSLPPAAGLALAAAAACGGDGGPPVTVRDSAGVEIVESRAPSWTEEEAWRVAEEPLLAIGRPDGPEEELLFQVGGALRLADGRILVADGGSSEVRVFGSEGRFLHAIGGAGQGPGELGRLAGVAVAGDSLFVLDGELGRLSVFDLDGAFRLSFRLEPTGDPIRPLRLYGLEGRFPDGSLVLAPRAFPADLRERAVLYWDSVPHLLYDPNGTVRDTIGPFGGLEIFATPEFSTAPPFAHHAVADVEGDRFVVGRSFTWRLDVHGPDGRLLRSVRRADEPPAVPAGEVERAREALERIPDEETRRRAREREASTELPERVPAYAGLLVDREGHLWVQEYRAPRDEGPVAWSVFSPEGRWLGTVDLREGLVPTDIGADYVLGVRRAALEVERVELYRLDRAPAAGRWLTPR